MRHKELLKKKEEAKAQPPPEVYNGPVSKAFCLSVNKKVDKNDMRISETIV